MPLHFDPLKSLNIDPFRYVNDPLAVNNPFASVNKQLKALGLDPIGFGTPVAQRAGVPSAHTALDDLPPEQLLDAQKKAGGGLMSGLEWVGRKLDSVLGARAARGLLGGKPRELLSFGPLGLISDELGLTDKKDIVGGRQLLESAGILGPNKPGFDAGDVAGFAAEVLLDPSTYFFGLGLGSKGVLAATKAGKSLGKIGKLEDVLSLAKTTKGAKALGLPKKMGPRQAGMNLTLDDIIRAEASGGLDDILGLPGLRHKGVVVGGGLGQPNIRSSILGEIADAGEDVAKVMSQPLTSPAHVGLPGFMARGPLKGLRRRPMDFKPGGPMEGWAQIMDKAGAGVRWSLPGRQLARVFNPKLRRTASGEYVPLTRIAQEASLREYRFMENTAQQAHSAGFEFGQKWKDSIHFDAQKIIDDVDTPAYRNIDTIEDADQAIQKNFDYMNSHLEGYEIRTSTVDRVLPDGTTVSEIVTKMEIPEWHGDIVKRLQKNYGNRVDDFNKRMNDLEVGKDGRMTKVRAASIAAQRFKQTADPIQLRLTNKLTKEAAKIQKQIDELKAVRDIDAAQLKKVMDSRASDDISRAVDHTKRWEQAEWRMQGGVHNRADAQLPAHLQELSGDLAKIAKRHSDALDYARRRGLDIEALTDNYAMFNPRRLFKVPETTKRGVLSQALEQRGYAGYGVKHQLRRGEGMRGWFGGTTFINKLSRNKAYVGRITEGMGDIEKQGIIDEIAEGLIKGEINEVRLAGGESLKALQEMGIVDELGAFTNAIKRNPAGNSDISRLAEFLGELDPRILDIGVSAFEQNPIVAMMGYYVDVVRAAHSVEVAANIIGSHGDLMINLGADGYKGIDILKMMKTWNKTSSGIQRAGGIPPALHFQVIKKLVTQNDKWDEIFNYVTTEIKSPFAKLDDAFVAKIRDGDIDDLVRMYGDDEKLLGEIRTLFKDVGLPQDLGKDVARYVNAVVDPASMGDFIRGWDHMTDILKTSFTTPWPAFHFRNFLSGQMNNYFIGAYDPTVGPIMRYVQPVLDARTLLRGGTIKGIAENMPRFRGGKNIPAWFKGNPDDYVSEWIRSQARAYELIGPQHTREHLQAITEQGGRYDLFRSRFYDEVPGERVLGQRLRDIRRPKEPGEGIFERHPSEYVEPVGEGRYLDIPPSVNGETVLPAGTKLWHGTTAPQAADIKSTGGILSGQPQVSAGARGERDLVWLTTDYQDAGRFAEGAEQGVVGMKQAKGEVFTAELGREVRLLDINARLTEEQAEILGRINPRQHYAPIKAGETIQHAMGSFQQWTARTYTWGEVLGAIGYDGLRQGWYGEFDWIAINVNKVPIAGFTPSRRMAQARTGASYGKGGKLKKFVGSAREIGHEVEGYNRLAPLVAFLKQGYSLDEAAKKVRLAQVDYSALTDVERRVFRRIIPFYTFTRRQIPFVIERLADPSGSMSQAVKGITRIKREMQDEENPTPDWISSEFTIPIPGGVEGQQRYLTRAGGVLGGMEDVFSLFKPGRTAMGATRRTLSGIGSRIHPIAQAPIELMTGQSLFLQRPLSETKPATARMIGGVMGLERVPSFPGPITESVISRLPGFGRSVSTIRSLTDPRRPLTVDGQVSFLNIAARMLPSLTGLRISEVNMERIKNRIMQEAIEEHLKHNTSIRTFKHIYVPEAELANMDEESRALYLLYKQISSQAAKASRARKKEQSQASAYSM